MKKTLLSLVACMLVFAGADAQKAKATHKKHIKKHSSSSKPTYYYNSDGTISDKPVTATESDARRPSAYKGDNVPENDGVKKNAQRNINYNSGQALPSSSGK